MNIPSKHLLSLLTVCAPLLLCVNLSAGDKNDSPYTLVIDAGHGGKDPGAVHGGKREKDINLAVALKLGRLVSDNCPDIKVIYTRKTDVFIGLNERGAIANRANANLFISLHANAVENNSSAKGAITYIMGMDKTQNNLKEAMRENAVMKYEDDYSQKYEGFDPTSAESYIIFSLMQYAYFDRSLQFANTIQKHYASGTGFADRGAKQAPFYVLWKSAMPSVLTEMGFISNESDRKYITSEKGQEETAKAIYNAFREYYRESGERKPTGPLSDGVSVPSAVSGSGTADSGAGIPDAVPSPGFYVQLCASRTRIPLGDARFRDLPGPVAEKRVDGWYKYVLGPCQTEDEAQKMQGKTRKGVFRDAFITAFDGDRQIGVTEARVRMAANK